MIKLIFLLLLLTLSVHALVIKQMPISFSKERQNLTLEYMQKHYAITQKNIVITPKIIIIHYTAINSLKGSFQAFNPEKLPSSRSDIASKNASVNVSVPYLIDTDGTIYQLMPDNWMGRHVIGLNFNSIGIENVGTLNTLTPAQLRSNIALVKYLKNKYPSISYLSPHSDYRCFESSPLWLERDKGYRTHKEDPGSLFMSKIYSAITDLKKAPCHP